MNTSKSYNNPLAAYLHGSANSDQIDQVRDWADDDAHNRTLLDDLETVYQAGLSDDQKPKTGKAFPCDTSKLNR